MLNQALTWNNVEAISTGPGTHVRDAFQLMFGDPIKELLPAGTELYKFNGFSSLAAGAVTDATPLSPWRSPVAAFKHDAGLVQRLKIAEANGVSMREWGRLTSVIKENWSSLDWLLTIALAEPVYAWFGGFKGMARIDAGAQSRRNSALEGKGGTKNLPGGGTQFYIPNLTVAQSRRTRSGRSDAPARAGRPTLAQVPGIAPIHRPGRRPDTSRCLAPRRNLARHRWQRPDDSGREARAMPDISG